jgi:hypothetical protein
MRKYLMTAAALLICQTAQADPLTDDIRCYVITLGMLATKDTTQQMVATMAHSYWLGRIDGRAPDVDLETRVLAELPILTNPELFKTEAIRCGQIMVARGQAETKMGTDLKQLGLKAQQEENAR